LKLEELEMVSKQVGDLEITSIIPFDIPILGTSLLTLMVKTDSELIKVVNNSNVVS
jgi:hypothetical protein